MRTIYIFFCSIFASGFISAQVPGIKWTKYVKANVAEGEIIFESLVTNDGEYVLVGVDTSFAPDYSRNSVIYSKYSLGRAWIAKLDSGGTRVWSDTTFTVDPHSSGFLSVCNTSAGLYVAAGHGHVTGWMSPSHFYIAAYNNVGDFQWDTTYGGSLTDRAYSIRPTADGGFIIAGFTESNDGNVSGNHSPGTADVWLVKIDAARNIQWQKCYGGSGADTAYAVVETPDNGYLVAGVSTSSNGNLTGNNGLSDGWIFKTDNSGNILWQRNIGGTDAEALKNIVINSDSTYTLAGYTNSASVLNNGIKGNSDLWVITVSADDGATIWSKGFGGSSFDHGYSVKRTIGNGFLVGGYTESLDGDVTNQSGRADAWILNLTNDGTLIWQKAIGTAKDEFGMTAHYLSVSDFAITGFANPNPPVSDDSTDGYVVRLGNINTIKGTLFYDVNANGIKDPGEGNFDFATVKTEKGTYQQTTIPSNGQFLMYVDTGIYNTSVIFQLPYYNVVPATQVSSFATYFNVDSFSFAIQPIPSIRDLTISAVALSRARPGFNVSYQLFYKNVGTDTVPSGTVLLKKDNRLNFLSAIPAITSSNGDTLKWDYSNFKPNDTASILINFQVPVPPTVNIGDTLRSMAIITPVSGDVTPANDTSEIKQRVVGAFDPNDKYENLGGRLSPAQVSSQVFINYIIRFQNTGTDTAFNAIVRDTLDSKLDWSTFEMVAASHSYLVSITNENELEWSFTDILLPDSNVNEPASHGYIIYRIKPNNTLVAGEIIENSASIYFDFNLPVKTNDVLTQVEIDNALPLTLMSFTGAYRDNASYLNWSTINEYNVRQFEIQRSLNASDFTGIGEQRALGGMGIVKDYSFRDDLANIPANKFFYRLKQIDLDGKINYSPILILRKSNDLNAFSIIPNPAGDFATINLSVASRTKIGLKILDVNGKSVFSVNRKLSEGNNSILLRLSGLPAGYYLVHIQNENINISAPLIKK